MSFLELNNVSKGYGSGIDRTEVLSNINIHIEEGEFVAIVGFSGSGKTTLISLINGLLRPDEGEVLLKGKPVVGPGPDRGVVFQNYSLLPWLSVKDNVAIAVDECFPKMPRSERRQKVEHYVEMVNLTHALDKKPAELSGGMRQRVSVARALAMMPEILLLDEPLSALDALTRGTLQDEILKIWSEEKRTVLMITNDVDEGLYMADRIIPLTLGPKATLGPEFKVNLERPRDKMALNKNREFIKTRNEIIEYLMEIGEVRKSSTGREIKLPDLKPVMPGRISWDPRRNFKERIRFFNAKT